MNQPDLGAGIQFHGHFDMTPLSNRVRI